MAITILTVDDSKTMRNMLKLALDAVGFNVVQAEDGIEGLAVLKRDLPDVVVTDINMPNMDGFEFISAVRNEPHYCTIPILVLTTESNEIKKAKARQAGATGWIVKPFESKRLVAAIRRVAF